MHLEMCSHSARSGLITSETVKKGSPALPTYSFLCLREHVLAYDSCCRLFFLARTGRFLVWPWLESSVWQVPRWSGSTLAWGCRALPVSRLTLTRCALCGALGDAAEAEERYPGVTDGDTASTAEEGLFQGQNSVVRSGKELYLVYLLLWSLLSLKQIIFFISFVFLFVCL